MFVALCYLQFPETPADLDEFDSQKPSPLAQGFDSGPIKQENVPRTAERQPTENSESRGSVNSSVAPFEYWQIEVWVTTISNSSF